MGPVLEGARKGRALGGSYVQRECDRGQCDISVIGIVTCQCDRECDISVTGIMTCQCDNISVNEPGV